MRKWLYPGMNVKRWIALLFLGIVIIALGFAYVLREVYNTYSFPDFVWYLTLQFIPRYVRGTLFATVGIGAIVIAVWQLNRNLLSVLMPAGRDSRLVDMIYQQRQLKRGPKIVAVGGGTGLSTLLRGLKEHTGNLTAIVTVADDGGSSGRLRRELGVLPPGDFRNCIAALADVEPLMTRLLEYRFSEGSGLEGHSFGNLFIVAMSGVTDSFEQAIRETSRVLAVQGQILPSTLANVTLSARLEGEDTVHGESNIGHSRRSIKQLYLDPEDAQAHPETVRALLAADLIVLGPGSLYTSILPNLMVRGIQDAIRNSPAVKVYVCNVATQPGETDRYRVSDHVEALERHVGPGLFNYVLANNNVHTSLPADWDVDIVVTTDEEMPTGLQLISADVVNEDYRLRHDPVKLASALLNLYHEHGHNRTESKREVATAAAR